MFRHVICCKKYLKCMLGNTKKCIAQQILIINICKRVLVQDSGAGDFFTPTVSACICAGMCTCWCIAHLRWSVCAFMCLWWVGSLSDGRGYFPHFLWGVGGVLNKEALSCLLEPAGWKLAAACSPASHSAVVDQPVKKKTKKKNLLSCLIPSSEK